MDESWSENNAVISNSWLVARFGIPQAKNESFLVVPGEHHSQDIHFEKTPEIEIGRPKSCTLGRPEKRTVHDHPEIRLVLGPIFYFFLLPYLQNSLNSNADF